MADAIIGFSGKRKGVKMKKTRKILIFCIACVFATAMFFSFYKDDVKVSADSSSVVTQQSSLSASAYEKYISEKTAEHKAKYGEQTLTPTLSESIKVKGENYVEVGGIAADGYSEPIKLLSIADYSAYQNVALREVTLVELQPHFFVFRL